MSKADDDEIDDLLVMVKGKGKAGSEVVRATTCHRPPVFKTARIFFVLKIARFPCGTVMLSVENLHGLRSLAGPVPICRVSRVAVLREKGNEKSRCLRPTLVWAPWCRPARVEFLRVTERCGQIGHMWSLSRCAAVVAAVLDGVQPSLCSPLGWHSFDFTWDEKTTPITLVLQRIGNPTGWC